MLSDKADKSKLGTGKEDMLGQYRQLTPYVASTYLPAVICDAVSSATHLSVQKNSCDLMTSTR